MENIDLMVYIGFFIFLALIAFMFRKDIQSKIGSIGLKNMPRHYLIIFARWCLRGLYVSAICIVIDIALYLIQKAAGMESKFYIVPRGW